jgi:quercetin dioxygenase-like cupin family protein
MTQYFYNLKEEKQGYIGPDYSSAHGPVVKGERVQIALVHKVKGTGSRLHTHPNEQFIFVLKGKIKARVHDQEKLVSPGTLIHIPPNAPHYMIAAPGEDIEYFVSKDTSWGIAGTAVDGKKTGAHYEPGFEPQD